MKKIAYIGDDLNDLSVLKEVGLSAMPSQSPILVVQPDIVTVKMGKVV